MSVPLPVELRARIVAAVQEGMSWVEAAEVFRVGRASVNRYMRLMREKNSVEPMPHGGGQTHRIPDDALPTLRAVARSAPRCDDRADSRRLLRADRLDRERSDGGACGAGQAGYVAEKKSFVYAEQARDRVQEARFRYRDEVSGIAPGRLVFLDETGTHVSMTRACAWAPIGQRAHDLVIRNRGRVLTVLGAIALDGVRAMMTVEGGTTREVFLRFIREHLGPSLRPGDVVVMDNLGAHHARDVRQEIEATGATVLFTPPYSPDMNPIEICWAKLKALVRAGRATTLRELADVVRNASQAVTLDDLAGWFRHCGYQLQGM